MNIKTVDGLPVRTRDGWAICPHCNRGKILRLRPDTSAHHLIAYCKKCTQEAVLNIE